MIPSRAVFKHLALISAFLLPAGTSWARPEYALKEKQSCTTCHWNAWGGGPRTLVGKGYGTHGQGSTPTASSDAYYGDLRVIAFFPWADTHDRPHGVAQMETAAAANVALAPGNGSDSTDARVIASYDFGQLSGGMLREAYLRLGRVWNDQGLYLTIGHFYSPFGLLTDEHRTYTRIQTNSTINNFNVGAALSGDLSTSWHFDLALVNDFQTGGRLQNGDITWGGVLNARWNPVSAPILLGASANYEHITVAKAPYAGSLYAGLNVSSATLLVEGVLARNWNNSVVNSGGSNPSLPVFFQLPSGGSNDTSTSLGSYALLRYDLSPAFSLFYKFDYFSADVARANERYSRHGLGFESYLLPNVILGGRVELQKSPESSRIANAIAAQDDFFLMLRVWI